MIVYSCLVCAGFLGHSFKKLLGHIKFIHRHEPNFSITCGDCGQSFRKFSSFKTHIRRKQEKKTRAERAVLGEEVEENALSDDERDFDEEEETKDYIHDVTKFLALFLLKTKEENQLNQQTINAILDNTEDVVESSVQCLKDKIIARLTNNEIQVADVAGLNDILVEPSVFSRARGPLANEYLQMKYFVENFDLEVIPWSSGILLSFF